MPTWLGQTVGRTSPGIMVEGRAMQEHLPRDAAVERTGMYSQGESPPGERGRPGVQRVLPSHVGILCYSSAIIKGSKKHGLSACL